MQANPIDGRPRQSGLALFFGLIFLLVTTLIGITGMRVTSLQENMTGNTRSHSLALQAAESALREGENMVKAQAGSLAFAGCTNGLYGPACAPFQSAVGNCAAPCPLQMAYLQDEFWSSGNAANYIVYQAASDTLSLAQLAARPRFVIEQLSDPGFYQITAYGMGGTTTAVTILQTTFRQ